MTKRDDGNFSIVTSPHLFGNVPPSPAHGVYISQLKYVDAYSSEAPDPTFGISRGLYSPPFSDR
jgi:hypothetical protein